MQEFMVTLTSAIEQMNQVIHFPKIGPSDFIEILILITLAYYVILAIRGTRVWVLLKGLGVLLAVYVISSLAGFTVIVAMFNKLLIFIGIGIIVIMQADIRKFVEKIGTSHRIQYGIKDTISLITLVFKKDTRKYIDTENRELNNMIDNLVKSCVSMGKVKTGALIAIERKIPLDQFISTGININSDITSQLILNIFEHNTPLHDGAMIIRDGRISSATCYLPLSENNGISKELGTRHRASIGLTEQTDALVIAVSEETGGISLSVNGQIKRNLEEEQLRDLLTKELGNQQNSTQAYKNSMNIKEKWYNRDTRNTKLKIWVSLTVLIIWGTAINNIDPIETIKISNVDIELKNEQLLTDMDMTYTLTNPTKTDVYVTGRKKQLDALVPGDITIIADFKNTSITNSIELQTIVKNKELQTSLSRSTINLQIEEKVSAEFDVLVELDKTVNNMLISKVNLDKETITLSGAKSKISKIGKAVVTLEKQDIGDSNFQKNIIIYDKNGEDMTKDIVKEPSSLIATGEVEYLKTKTIELKITPVFKNEVLESYLSNVAIDKRSVTIAGSESELSNISKLELDVPIDISVDDMQKKEFIKSVDLTSYLEGAFKVIDSDRNINLNITFKPSEHSNIKVYKADIVKTGAKSYYDYQIKTQDVDVTLVYEGGKELYSLNESDLQFSIPVGGLPLGTHQVKLEMIDKKSNRTQGIQIYKPVYLEVQVTNSK